jgi:hypothetical protein
LQVLLVPQVLPNDGTQNIFGPSKMDPRTSGSGALSEPIASTTMSIGIKQR